jgi:hypothetical protein
MVRNVAANWPLIQATANPTSAPATIPAPPRSAVGRVCMRRASG